MHLENKPTVAIIGAGASGINTFIQLQNKLGITAQLFELSNQVGGTWNYNTYPGCSCDVSSHIYCLRSDLNPNWSSNYSPQKEILEYFKSVAKKHHVLENTRFQTEVLRTIWINEKKQWKLDIRSRDQLVESVYYDIVFSAVGCLRIPHFPSEFKAFEGPILHTAAWDSSIDFTNKRIALVGSGSSAIQTLPFLAKNASHLISYQRSPAWIFPRPQIEYSESVKWMFRYIPLTMVLYRLFLYIYGEMLYVAFGYPGSWFSRQIEKNVVYSNEKQLKDLGRPDLIPLLKPTYRMGCKRVVFTSNYFEAVAQPNVSVVRSPIKEIKPNGIVTEDGHMEEFDILVLGTGFKTQEGMLGDIEFIGSEGQSLTELWKKKPPQFYKSTIAHGFPNLFMLLGPNTILGHSSVLLMMEAQVNYAVSCIKELMLKRGLSTIEPTEDAQARYMSQLRSDLKGTVWTTSCHSWYKNEAGEITSLYPNSVSRFKWDLNKLDTHDFVKHPIKH